MASSMEPGLAGDGASTLPVIAATPARLIVPLYKNIFIRILYSIFYYY
jgi:hypothetical protein